MSIADTANALADLERMVAAVNGEAPESRFAKVLTNLESLSRQEGIPMAIVGGLAAIHLGYRRFTKDIAVVVHSGHLDVLARRLPIWDQGDLEGPRRMAEIAVRRRLD
jgi:hypothetical protein